MKIKISRDLGEEIIEKLAEFLILVKKKLQEKGSEKERTSSHSC
jgi:hypothetical protein